MTVSRDKLNKSSADREPATFHQVWLKLRLLLAAAGGGDVKENLEYF